MAEKPDGVKREVLCGKEYSAGVGSAENVTSDQSAKHGPRFCLQPEKLSLSLSNAPTFDLSATDGTGITPVYLSVFWEGGKGVECVGGEKANLGCHFPGVSVEEEGLLLPFLFEICRISARRSRYIESLHLSHCYTTRDILH